MAALAPPPAVAEPVLATGYSEVPVAAAFSLPVHGLDLAVDPALAIGDKKRRPMGYAHNTSTLPPPPTPTTRILARNWIARGGAHGVRTGGTEKSLVILQGKYPRYPREA